MRVPLKELLEKMAVYRVLSAYETQPWMHYDDEKGVMCSAEVRMGPGADYVEAEVQFMYDDPPETLEHNPEQIMIMRAISSGDGVWSPVAAKIKSVDYVNKIGDWEKKCCNFFTACVQALQMGELPDIDALIEKELPDDEDGRRGRGKIGRKSPKVNPNALLGMKSGM